MGVKNVLIQIENLRNRVRRREPGDDTLGLSHIVMLSIERWTDKDIKKYTMIFFQTISKILIHTMQNIEMKQLNLNHQP